MNIEKEIIQIKNNIKNFNNNNNQLSCNTHDKNNKDNLGEKNLKSNQNQGNNYTLEQFKFQQNYLNYKRNKNKKKYTFNIINSTDDLIKMIDEVDYKKPWNKLDNYQQKVKISEYLKELNLTKEEKNNKSEKYLKLLNDKNFNKIINYSIEEKKIISIKDT